MRGELICCLRCEVSIADELRGVWMQGDHGDLGEESVGFDLAMGAEARRVAFDRFDAMAQSRRLEEKFCEVIAKSR